MGLNGSDYAPLCYHYNFEFKDEIEKKKDN